MLDTYIHEFLILFVCKWIKWLIPPLNAGLFSVQVIFYTEMVKAKTKKEEKILGIRLN